MTERPQLPFRDRQHAGAELARRLERYAGCDDVLVLALPRGGVPVAYVIAERLGLPLDVFLVRKLGVPGHEELAMGAIATGGVRVLNDDVVGPLRVAEEDIERVAERERRELRRREEAYRGTDRAPDLEGCVAILVDDGLATGSTMRAAVQAARRQGPTKVVVAVPVAAPDVCREFEREVDEVVCAATPPDFRAVGLWYEDFSQTTDDEVRELLAHAGDRSAP